MRCCWILPFLVACGSTGAAEKRSSPDPRPPALKGQSLTIFPGETIFVEAERVGDELRLERIVERPERPERTLSFKFREVGYRNMMLTVENPFDRPLKFDLGIAAHAGGPFSKTSSCPVIAGGSVFENWPHPIAQLVIVRLRFLADDTAMRCE
jgi:hypothetical protein